MLMAGVGGAGICNKLCHIRPDLMLDIVFSKSIFWTSEDLFHKYEKT